MLFFKNQVIIHRSQGQAKYISHFLYFRHIEMLFILAIIMEHISKMLSLVAITYGLVSEPHFNFI